LVQQPLHIMHATYPPEPLTLLGLGVIENILLVLDLNVLNTPLGPLTPFADLTRPSTRRVTLSIHIKVNTRYLEPAHVAQPT